ncbi:MAG: MASE1 domain-containing protein [Rhizobiales bacterium]|nr:MASE1 domain-containing protein [Hyphomicrobiales bacterium]
MVDVLRTSARRTAAAHGLRAVPLHRYALVGALFTAAYLGLEWLTRVHELEALGITLWNPVKALSLGLLLIEGLVYTPILFLAALLAELLIYGAAKTAASMMATSAVVAFGYAALAAVLRRGFGFALHRPDLRNVVALLLTVPAGAFAIACIYCGLLVLFGDLSGSQYWEAVPHLWVGDTVGIVIVLPVAMAATGPLQRLLETRPALLLLDTALFLAGVTMALWLIFGFARANEFHFFYLLFLPISWIAMRTGFAGAAVGLCFTHLMLVALIGWGGYPATTFMAYQLLVLALAVTGLLLGAVVDERRRSDQMLRSQHAAVARMARHATAGAMGVTLAHQISQPLSNVAVYLHVGRQLLAAKPADIQPVADALDKASGQLGRAKEVLERLRDFVSRGTLRPAPTDLGALLRKVVALAEDDARAHGVSVRLEAVPVPSVTVDALQIEQTLINLVNNAIDAAAEAAHPPGSVTVRLGRSDGHVWIAIEDDGPGVSAEISEHIFEPFVTTKPRGMGLGLALSRELIRAHGGSIDWQRIEQGGTRFTVELPCDPESTHAA